MQEIGVVLSEIGRMLLEMSLASQIRSVVPDRAVPQNRRRQPGRPPRTSFDRKGDPTIGLPGLFEIGLPADR